VAAVIDGEIRSLIAEAHTRAEAVLAQHRVTLDSMAGQLMEKETLDALDLADILGPLPPWPTTDVATRSAEDRPTGGGDAPDGRPTSDAVVEGAPSPGAATDGAGPAPSRSRSLPRSAAATRSTAAAAGSPKAAAAKRGRPPTPPTGQAARRSARPAPLPVDDPAVGRRSARQTKPSES
jgi:cell division protease FtsH